MSDDEIKERARSYFLEASNDDGWIDASTHGYAFGKLVELLKEFERRAKGQPPEENQRGGFPPKELR